MVAQGHGKFCADADPGISPTQKELATTDQIIEIFSTLHTIYLLFKTQFVMKPIVKISSMLLVHSSRRLINSIHVSSSLKKLWANKNINYLEYVLQS